MTNKLVVIINSLKVPKIKIILLYEMKFLVPNYSCLQNPWLGGYRPPILSLYVLCPQLNLLTPSPPHPRTKFLGTPLQVSLSSGKLVIDFALPPFVGMLYPEQWFNPLTPNDTYSGRTAPLTSKRCILYIYWTNRGTECFKHGINSPFSSLQNAVCFIFLTYLVPV